MGARVFPQVKPCCVTSRAPSVPKLPGNCSGKAELKGKVTGGDPCPVLSGSSEEPQWVIGQASSFPVSFRGRQGGRCIGRWARLLLEPQNLSVLGNRAEVKGVGEGERLSLVVEPAFISLYN